MGTISRQLLYAISVVAGGFSAMVWAWMNEDTLGVVLAGFFFMLGFLVAINMIVTESSSKSEQQTKRSLK